MISTTMQNNNRLKKFAAFVGVGLFWILVWQLAYYGVGRDLLLASPLAVLKRLGSLIVTGSFWLIIATSFWRIMLGFLIGLVIGTVLGILTAASRPARRLLRLPMNIIKATPVASFVILALVWISGRNLSTFIGFLMVLPLIHSNVEQGLLSADPQLLEVAKVYRLTKWQTAKAVYLPAVMPYFLSALRVSLGYAWKAGIAGEVIAIPRDAIGTQLYNAKVYLETTDLFAWTVVIVVLSILIEKMLTLLIQRAVRRWGGDA